MNKNEHVEIEDLRQALEKKAAEAHAASKELEKFSYSVSHDLRAPLRAIEGFTKILLEDYLERLDEEGQRYLKIIETSSRKMTLLLDDILLFSRMGRKEISCSDVNMCEAVNSAWAELRPPPSRKIDLKVQSLPNVECDPVLIEHVWKQLLSNAIKFTAPKEKAIVEVSGTKKSDRVIYSVTDNGVGFDMKLAPKLFGVFQRLHTPDEFEGNGIGLAIVQRLVRRHAGDVAVEAKPGGGATFSFWLPTKREVAKN